jgi:hypothetical protein
MESIALITGTTPERVYGRGLGEPAREETPAMRHRRELRALTHYRQMLGIAGRPRVREDGQVVRRGVSARVQARLERETGVRREQLLKRVRHFTQGVIIGSRAFIDGWFEQNRRWFRGRSAEKRKSGARKIARDWTEIYNLRQLRE